MYKYVWTHRDVHAHTYTLPLCCHADGGHRPWGLMSKILADMPWKKGFVVLLHHTYLFFSHLASSFSFPPSLPSFFFSLLSRYFSAAGPLNLPCLSPCLPFWPLHPPPLPHVRTPHPVIKRGHQLTLPPSSHLQNTNKTSLPHLSLKQRALPSLSFLFLFFLHCQSCPAFHLQLAVAGFALINCREFSTQSWGALTDQAKAPWHHWCERRF